MEPVKIGPYRLEGRLGAGGMGVVYRAHDERLDRRVAVKLIHTGGGETERERLRREARASARFNHAAIVQIFDLVEHEGSLAIVMELVEGTSVDRRIREGTLSPEEALAISREVAEALAVAHAHGIVHRDLKAENVLVTPDGHAKVLDFGMAKRLDGGEMSLTMDGMVVGTARAMSPEQARGEEIDFRTDLFALGVLLYEMFTEISPFLAPNAVATLERVCYYLPPPLRVVRPNLPRELSDLVERLLEKQPDRRPHDAREVAQLLADIAPAFARQESSRWEKTAEMPRASGRQPALPAGGERRQLTFLSCGLVRPAGGPLDAEELLEATEELDATVAAVIGRFGGSLKPGGSDGWQACFGYPKAHEDDARRAVTAALELVAGMGSARVRPTIGIDTGPMIVARTDSGDADPALGETPQIAMVLRRLASPGAVLVGAETCRLVSGFFDVEELTSIAMPGSPRALWVHRVVGGSSARNRVHAAGSLTPLVGCDQELGLLQERWELAREGRGQVVLLSGEAGLGKSRLILELRQRLGTGAAWLEGHASPFHRDSAFHPILHWLDQWIGADREDASGIRLARLEEALARHGLPLPEACPLIASLLGLPAGDRWPLPALPPDVQRRRTVEVLVAVLVASAERQPLVLVLEDLHWIDPSSSELLKLLAEQAAGLPLLLLATFRPEGAPAWEARSHLTHLTLAPLGRRQTSLMIDRICAGRDFDPAIREKIAERADGVPLFIEELMKMLEEWEGAPDGQKPREIPGSLEGWLGARLDRLDTARPVAQLASVLGREFSQDLLSAVAFWDAETLRREVDRLIAAEILYRQGLPPRCRYRFKHALLQDAAYSSLLRAERQRFHLRIAEILHERFQSLVESQPELAAHHFTAAGQPGQAVPLWQQAAEKALRMSAYPEAIAHLSRALPLLAEMPESTERDRREMVLQTALGVAIAKVGHEGMEEVNQAHSRAWALCSRAGGPADAMPILRGLYTNAIVRGEAGLALEYAEDLLRLAEQEGDPFFLLTAHEGAGMSHLLSGNPGRAREHLESSVAHVGARLTSRAAVIPGPGDPAIASYSNLAWALWFLGFPDSALEPVRAAQALVGNDTHPQARGFIAFHASKLHLFRREGEEACARARDLMALAAEPGLRGWQVLALRALGTALIGAGRSEEGLSVLEEVPADPRIAKLRIWMPLYYATIAEAGLARGETQEGLAAIDEGFSCSAATRQAFLDAELWRLRAALLQQGGAAETEVEPALSRALETARRQGARSLELRAATDLARLWAGQDRRAEARDLLAGVYDGFTEGFDTGDLRAARELLAGL